MDTGRQNRNLFCVLSGSCAPKFNAIVREVGKKTRCEQLFMSENVMDTKAQEIAFDLFFENVEIELEIVHEKQDETDCTNACAKHCPE